MRITRSHTEIWVNASGLLIWWQESPFDKKQNKTHTHKIITDFKASKSPWEEPQAMKLQQEHIKGWDSRVGALGGKTVSSFGLQVRLRTTNVQLNFSRILIFYEKVKVLVVHLCPTLCNPVGCMQPTRLLCPWNSPGQNTGVGCHSLLQVIFPTQGLNLGLLHCR